MTAKFPSFNWMRGVARDTRISVIYRFILLRLCIYRDEKTGQCNPGYQTVADELGVYRTTVLKAVDAAVRLGWLGPPIRTRRANASFVFIFPDQEVASAATSKQDQEVAQQQHQKNQEVAPDELRSRSKRVKKSLAERGSPAPSKTSKRNGLLTAKRTGKSQTLAPDVASLEEGDDATAKPDRKTNFVDTKKNGIHEVAGRNRKPKSASYDAQADSNDGDKKNDTIIGTTDPDADQKTGSYDPQTGVNDVCLFPDFWSSYPKRVAKEQARKAFAAAIKRGADPAELIAGAKRYANERAGQDQKYTKHPATWLNAECWLDESAPSGPVIDEHGNEIPTPSPRRSRPLSFEEAGAELLAEGGDYPSNRRLKR